MIDNVGAAATAFDGRTDTVQIPLLHGCADERARGVVTFSAGNPKQGGADREAMAALAGATTGFTEAGVSRGATLATAGAGFSASVCKRRLAHFIL
jgi:hypothetical protein